MQTDKYSKVILTLIASGIFFLGCGGGAEYEPEPKPSLEEVNELRQEIAELQQEIADLKEVVESRFSPREAHRFLSRTLPCMAR